MLRSENSESDWKPEHVLGQYDGALRCALIRGEEATYWSIYNAFICNWKRVVMNTYEASES